jgi:phage shock protein A
MNILKFFKIKAKTAGEKLDNLVTFDEKLRNAKEELQKTKLAVTKEAESIHESEKIAKKAYELNNAQIETVKTKLNKAIKEKEDNKAEALFSNLESLQSANKIYEKSYKDIQTSREKIDKQVVNIDNKIFKVAAKIDGLKQVRAAQEMVAKLAGVSSNNAVGNVLKDIEDFVEHEEWKLEAKQEVQDLLDKNSQVEDTEEEVASDTHERFEAYKASVLAEEK